MIERIPYGVLLGVAMALVGAAGMALGLLLGGGGEGDGLAEGVADDLYGRADGMLTEDEATCTAQALVADLGRPRVTELVGDQGSDEWLRVQDMTDDEKRTFATVSYDCIADEHIGEHLFESWIPFEQVPTPEARQCFAGGFVDDIGPERTRDVLVEIYVDSTVDLHDLLEEPERDLVDAIEARCFPEEGT
jgi:hypothetical protein